MKGLYYLIWLVVLNAAVVFYVHASVYYNPIANGKFVNELGEEVNIVVYQSKLYMNGKEYKIRAKRNDTLIIREDDDQGLPSESIILKDTTLTRQFFSNGFESEVTYTKDTVSR